jgi:hypothetical protein
MGGAHFERVAGVAARVCFPVPCDRSHHLGALNRRLLSIVPGCGAAGQRVCALAAQRSAGSAHDRLLVADSGLLFDKTTKGLGHTLIRQQRLRRAAWLCLSRCAVAAAAVLRRHDLTAPAARARCQSTPQMCACRLLLARYSLMPAAHQQQRRHRHVVVHMQHTPAASRRPQCPARTRTRLAHDAPPVQQQQREVLLHRRFKLRRRQVHVHLCARACAAHRA